MAELKSLIVKGASRFLNGVVADSITATIANIDNLNSTTATISSLQFNNTIFQDEGNFLVIKNSTSKILALKTSGTSDFVLRPADVENIKNNIDLGSSSIRWKDLYLDGVGYTNKVESYTNTGLILNGKTSTMLQLNGINYAGIASNGNFYFYKNNIRFQKVADNGYGEIYKNHSSSADYGSWFRDIASTTNGDVIAGISIAAHPNIKIGNSLLFTRGDTNYTIYGTHNLVLSDGLTSTSNNNNVTTIKVDLDGTYNSSTNKVATISSITNAINALDVSAQTGATNKTLTSIEQINGKISAEFQDIEISGEKITSGILNFSRLPTLYWANIAISNTSSTNTTPTFSSITLDTTTLSKGANLLTLGANNTTYYTFRTTSFGPTTDQVGSNIDLGTSATSCRWNNLYLKDSVYIYNTTDASKYIRLQNINSSGSYQVKIPNYSGHMWLAHVGSASAVGSSTQPVYVAENGRLTAITGALTNGSAYLTNYNHYSNSATQTINLNNDEVAVGAMFHFTVKANVTGSPGVDSTILQMNWTNNGGYNSQFGIQTTNDRVFFRRQSAGTWQNWQEIAHGPLNTQVGSSTQPVYLSNTGTITQGTQYAGGTNITLNGVSQGGSIANIYAPTTGATAGYVLQANGSGTNAPTWKPGVYYGECTDAKDTIAKKVTIPDFPSTLVEGQIVYVKFTNTNEATSASLNVSSTGAKQIRFGDQATYNRNGRTWAAGDTLGFIYDGSYWRLISAYAKSALNSYMSQFVTTRASATATATKYFIAGATTVNSSGTGLYLANNTSSTVNSSGIYFLGSEGVLYGAAWNDYAEFRHSEEKIEAGRVVKELGNGTLELVNERLARGCEIVSDTFGFAIGETDYCQLPTAASGRVLAYPDKNPSTFEIGAPVCSGPNGTISQMTEEEERLYPSRIIGTVSEIPTYKIWHGGKDVQVNGRIWIRIR